MKESEKEQKPTWRERLRDWRERFQFVTTSTLVILLLLVGFLWPRMFITVDPGHHAVKYRWLVGGTQTDRVWGEGLHLIYPWDELISYETRVQEKTVEVSALSGEGLLLEVSVAVRFVPYVETLGYLHREVGPDYFDRLIEPDVESHVRRIFGEHTAEEAYSSQRDVLQALSRVPLLGRLDSNAENDGKVALKPYIHVEELKLIGVKLPEVVTEAITEKHKQQQLMLEYTYRLKREEQEAERKRTEAAGIRDYNQIASQISPGLLRWRGIEAALELAKSDNAKVVVLGGGQSGGTPLILNVFDPGGSTDSSTTTKDTTDANSTTTTTKKTTTTTAAPTATSAATATP